jgi:hypothetical protein
MMLELSMTRQRDQWLQESIRQHLRFLVFDELYTYRGRQGSQDCHIKIQALLQWAENLNKHRQPFELLSVTNREYQQQKAASPSKSDLRSVWLPIVDEVRTFFVSMSNDFPVFKARP